MTAEVRRRVLAAWAASPARFREDANAEEDYALGGYRDRVIVELAQNAADAAARAGVPGRLRLTLTDGELVAANTGAPLDADGVSALSTLRASAKRDGGVGRFGVGFTAVVSVSDEPSISSRAGLSVRWSADQTRALVAEIPALADELKLRRGNVPVLRLPFDGTPEAVDGYDTVVRLPLRDADAIAAVRRQLAEAGPALLLALPALAAIELDDRVLELDGDAWRTVEAGGPLTAELLADRPTEERARPYWSLRWAAPADGLPRVVHAPTPSDEPLGFPALLIASFPLAPDRRHVAPGPLTDFLLERAAESYLELLRAFPGPELLDLIPGPLAEGALDAKIRRAVLSRLPDTPLIGVQPRGSTSGSDHGSRWTGAAEDVGAREAAAGLAEGDHPADHDGEPVRRRGRDCSVVDGTAALLEILGGVMPGLLPFGWSARHPALGALGVRRVEMADVVDALASLERPPAWWHELYDALAGAATSELGALPVPLTDGRLVRGPRGLLIPHETTTEGLEVFGLRFVHPDAVHPLLLRLGAAEAGPRQILADPGVREAVTGSFDSQDAALIADAVLSLAGGLLPGAEPWLAELALPGADGDLYPAGELLFPDSPLRQVMADSPFGVIAQEALDRYGREALEAVGVLRTFSLLRAEDVSEVQDLELDGVEDWEEELLGGHEYPPYLPEFTAVRDLELVTDWQAALPLLGEPPLRQAVVDPLHAMVGSERVSIPSYTSWWLKRNAVLGGPMRAPGSDPLLEGLYDLAPDGLDPVFARALGVRVALADVTPEELLDLLADPDRTVGRAQLRALWTWLADAGEATPPEFVRAVVDGVIEVVPSDDAIVLDTPAALPLLAGQPLILAAHDRAADLAELMDLSLASEELPGEITSVGVEHEVPAAVHAVLPEAPRTYVHHDRLVVDGQHLPWWGLNADGPAGLARALAWHAGRWPDRFLIEALLRTPAATADLLAESDLEPS
ncbi:MAG: hypothetical protein ABIS86_11045 [Streptosporangiaceae bacterium]